MKIVLNRVWKWWHDEEQYIGAILTIASYVTNVYFTFKTILVLCLGQDAIIFICKYFPCFVIHFEW